MCDDDENDYKAYERMHGSHSYRSPEYEHRMGRERGYDYEARSYQYPYSRYDREELDRDSKRYREDDRERMEREREMRDRGLRSTRETRNTNVIKAISDCCCTTQRSIDAVNLNLTQMNADNRLSICQQTNTLQNAITSGFCNLSSENATRFNILGAKIDAQTQIINDKFCQLEMREMQNKIDTLRDEKNALQSSALLQQQTSNIVSQIKPCPVPAYLTCNPYGCNGGLNGYGYGYPYGYGDSCCA